MTKILFDQGAPGYITRAVKESPQIWYASLCVYSLRFFFHIFCCISVFPEAMHLTPSDAETEKGDYSMTSSKRRISSPSTTDVEPATFTAKDEQLLLRRIDVIVLPLLCAAAFLQVKAESPSWSQTSLHHAACALHYQSHGSTWINLLSALPPCWAFMRIRESLKTSSAGWVRYCSSAPLCFRLVFFIVPLCFVHVFVCNTNAVRS